LLITSRASSWWRISMFDSGMAFPQIETAAVAAVFHPGNGSAIRQGDVEFQDGATALVFQRHMHLVLLDLDVLADHLDQFLLQCRQVVRLAALAALVGDDDRQALFRDRRRGFLLAFTKEV